MAPRRISRVRYEKHTMKKRSTFLAVEVERFFFHTKKIDR